MSKTQETRFLEFQIEEGLAFKRVPIFANEVPCYGYFADFLSSDFKTIIEYEVKTSLSDFKADFKKLEKHKQYANTEYAPNKFYYVVTPELYEKIKSLKLPNDKYGIMVGMKIKKRAKLLHSKYHLSIEREIAKRICRLYYFEGHSELRLIGD